MRKEQPGADGEERWAWGEAEVVALAVPPPVDLSEYAAMTQAAADELLAVLTRIVDRVAREAA